MARPQNLGVVSLHNRNPLGITGEFVIETRIKRSGAPTGTNNAWYIFGHDRNGFNLANPANNPSASVVLSPGSVLNTYANRGSSTLTRVGATARNTWTLVQIFGDMDTGKFNYFVDGQMVIEGGDLRTWASGDRLDYIHIFTNVTTSDALYVDYINVLTEGVFFSYEGQIAEEIVPGKTLHISGRYSDSGASSEMMCVALYNDRGSLVKFARAQGALSGDKIKFAAELDIPSDVKTGSSIKVFFWETDTFIPIREAVSFPTH
jgi:hypothetical protein